MGTLLSSFESIMDKQLLPKEYCIRDGMHYPVTLLRPDLSIPFDQYSYLLKYISDERRERISGFRFDKDKSISLFTELLIRREAGKALSMPIEDIHFEYSAQGKPTLKDHPFFNFSVSHSHGIIAFTYSVDPVGIDIELIREMRERVAERFFRPEEVDMILEPKDFYTVWTRKEAYIKKTGEGLSRELNSFSVIGKYLPCHFDSIEYNGYMISIAY